MLCAVNELVMTTHYVQQFVFYPPEDADVDDVEEEILKRLDCDAVDGYTRSSRQSSSDSAKSLPVLIMTLYLENYHHVSGSPEEYVPDSSVDIISVIEDLNIGVETINNSTAPVIKD